MSSSSVISSFGVGTAVSCSVPFDSEFLGSRGGFVSCCASCCVGCPPARPGEAKREELAKFISLTHPYPPGFLGFADPSPAESTVSNGGCVVI